MMLVEVDLDNRDGKIVPGSFVTVALTLATPPEIMVPVEALVMNQQKPSVFVLDGDTVHARPVVVSDNDGSIVRLASGLRAGELVRSTSATTSAMARTCSRSRRRRRWTGCVGQITSYRGFAG